MFNCNFSASKSMRVVTTRLENINCQIIMYDWLVTGNPKSCHEPLCKLILRSTSTMVIGAFKVARGGDEGGAHERAKTTF